MSVCLKTGCSRDDFVTSTSGNICNVLLRENPKLDCDAVAHRQKLL